MDAQDPCPALRSSRRARPVRRHPNAGANKAESNALEAAHRDSSRAALGALQLTHSTPSVVMARNAALSDLQAKVHA